MFSVVSKVNPEYAKRICEELLPKIQGKVPLKDTEKICTVWTQNVGPFNQRVIHAGQLWSGEVLPNGDIVTYIKTVTGDGSYIVQMEKRNKQNLFKVLEARLGFLGPDGKLKIVTGPDRVRKAAQQIFRNTKPAKY